ncbi:hypothetical protein [Sediminibacterium sp.]|uniref:hypothetical protein n=1 Tax=Sediminibacterium sp. TaxID=1917865 RepID=UPI0025E00564|nr:hypothetical protein [Sediminibacterium sp.]
MPLYLHELSILIRLYKLAVKDNKAYVSSIIIQLNQLLHERNFQTLSQAECKRIRFYCYQCACAASLFKQLIGDKPTKNEILAACYFGIGVMFQDDLTDNPNYHYQSFMVRMRSSEKVVLDNRMEWLVWYTHQYILQFKKDDQDFLALIDEAEAAQAKSRAQLDGKLSEKELFDIIALKGGSSTYFVRALLTPKAGNAEKKWIYDLGELLQWTNDAFDIYKDHIEGIQNLFNDQTDLRHRRALMENKIIQLKQNLFQLNFSLKNKQLVWEMFFSIISRGLISLDQAINLQVSANGVFNVANYTRSALVCDMEKPKNILSCLHYLRKWK